MSRYARFTNLRIDGPDDDGVIELVLDAPHLNAVSEAAHGDLAEVWRAFDADPDVRAVLLRRPRDELLLALDGPADPVRDAARRVGGGAPPLERDDLQLVGPPPLARLARRAHARRVAADHHQPVHGLNLGSPP